MSDMQNLLSVALDEKIVQLRDGMNPTQRLLAQVISMNAPESALDLAAGILVWVLEYQPPAVREAKMAHVMDVVRGALGNPRLADRA